MKDWKLGLIVAGIYTLVYMTADACEALVAWWF